MKIQLQFQDSNPSINKAQSAKLQQRSVNILCQRMGVLNFVIDYAGSPKYDPKTPAARSKKSEHLNDSGNQLKLFKKIMINAASTKPKLKIKPTDAELKEILDKLIKEVKNLKQF